MYENYKNDFIIGIDHAYGNIKTANRTFKAGVAESDAEPVFGTNIMFYGGMYYLIGENHKEFSADKITDGEYDTIKMQESYRTKNPAFFER